MVERRSKQPTPLARKWIWHLRISAKADRFRITEDELARCAGLLSLLGEPEHSTDVLYAFRELVFSAKRKTPIARIIAVIPPRVEVLRHLTACVFAYLKVCGDAPRYPFKNVVFNPERVVDVMMQISDPETFVSSAIQIGFHHPGAVFHPAALEEVSSSFRGVAGDLADTEYAADAESRINVVVVGDA